MTMEFEHSPTMQCKINNGDDYLFKKQIKITLSNGSES